MLAIRVRGHECWSGMVVDTVVGRECTCSWRQAANMVISCAQSHVFNAGGLVELGRHRHLGEGASMREDGRETPVHLVHA